MATAKKRARRTGSRPLPEPRLLNDPRAIRALAHPARLAALEAFGGGAQLTATQLAERAGVSPSAMSYHLRALEKWGLVERVDSAGDGRKRPWRSYPGGFRTDNLPDAASAAATIALTESILGTVARELSAWFDAERSQPAGWRRAGGYDNNRLQLDADEVEEFRLMVREWIDAHRLREPGERPPGTRPVRVLAITVPLDVD